MTQHNRSKKHSHEWTALWANWGPYGPKDEHFHECFDGRCHHMLVGPGRNCDGKFSAHEITLGVNKKRIPAGKRD